MSDDGDHFGAIVGVAIGCVVGAMTYDTMGEGCLMWPVVGGILGEGLSYIGRRKDDDSSYKHAREKEQKQQARFDSRLDTLGKRLDRVVSAYCQMSPKSEAKTTQYPRIVSRIRNELEAPTRILPETLVTKYDLLKKIGLLQAA